MAINCFTSHTNGLNKGDARLKAATLLRSMNRREKVEEYLRKNRKIRFFSNKLT